MQNSIESKDLPLANLFLISLLTLSALLTACESWQLKSRDQNNLEINQNEQSTGPLSVSSSNPPLAPSVLIESPVSAQPTTTALPSPTEIANKNQFTPKIGIIVGPGHLRSFIAIGILQELQKAKLPITALLGLEWGSIPAALFSLHGQSNEIEWQMMKIKDKDIPKHSLISSKIESEPISNLNGFLTDAFTDSTIEQMKLPFTCLSLDLNKHQYFWMRRGVASRILQNCIAHPPYYYSESNLVAGVDLKLSSDYLKQMGANYIVFINILPSTSEFFEKIELNHSDEILWANHQQNISRTAGGLVDFVIDTNSITNKSLDFENRRDMVRKGQEIGLIAAKKLTLKLGL